MRTSNVPATSSNPAARPQPSTDCVEEQPSRQLGGRDVNVNPCVTAETGVTVLGMTMSWGGHPGCRVVVAQRRSI